MKVIKFKVVAKIFTKLSNLNTQLALLRWCLEQANNVNIGTCIIPFFPKEITVSNKTTTNIFIKVYYL